MARVSCTDEGSVSVQLVQCEATRGWMNGLVNRRGQRGNDYVLLYPEKKKKISS